MRLIALLTFTMLAACGADGEPEPVPGGIAVSGQARIGVVGGL